MNIPGSGLPIEARGLRAGRACTAAVATLFLGCSASGSGSGERTQTPWWTSGIPVPSSVQEAGDPDAGFAYLTSAGYFGCGLPSRFFAVAGPAATQPGTSAEPLPGRDVTVDGAPLPYTWNLAKNADGLDVVYPNRPSSTGSSGG
ncbi:MAG: hypothetical protein ACRENE_20065 [Polyangiaceae bacterium]